MNEYLKGNKLYGDDFSIDQILKWYRDEEEGYANLGAKDRENYKYSYHALNKFHGFRYISCKNKLNVLGYGSAYGDELHPAINNTDRITILDPSDAFTSNNISGVPTNYVKPAADGTIPFSDNSFDLITCLGVLHHIPNVSYVISELYRVLKPGGYFLLKEPTVSMGDWSKPRGGLTKRERGIPLNILDNIISNNRFKVIHECRCNFSLTGKISRLLKLPAFNSTVVVVLDLIFSKLFGWNKVYHATNAIQKLRPCSKYYVLSK